MPKDGDERWQVYQKHYLGAGMKQPSNLWNDVAGNKKATKELNALFDDRKVFDHPKPVGLLQRIISMATSAHPNHIVMDFFGGSGTTAQGVLELNKQDGGNRSFILVQLPEPTYRKDFPTISDITKERVRRVIRKLNTEDSGQFDLENTHHQDQGFRVFKLDTSNFTPWDGEQPEDVDSVAKQLDLHVEHILTGRTQEDILTELLLKSGFPLSTKVESTELAGKKVFSVEEGTMLVCLEEELTNEVIRAMAEKKPSRVICLDAGFHGNDQLKTNAVQTMKARGVTSFRTV